MLPTIRERSQYPLRRPEQEKQLQDLCDEPKGSLKGLVQVVTDLGQWNLSPPLAVIDARKYPRQVHLVPVLYASS